VGHASGAFRFLRPSPEKPPAPLRRATIIGAFSPPVKSTTATAAGNSFARPPCPPAGDEFSAAADDGRKTANMTAGNGEHDGRKQRRRRSGRFIDVKMR
jgi:hypothetical protein